MNTLVYQSDLGERVNLVPPVRDGPMPTEPRIPAASAPTEVQSNHTASPASAVHTHPWGHRLGRDVDSPDLVNFPFAFTVSMILMTGLIAVASGIIVTSAWLTVVGLFITLLGCALCGWSLYDG